jgi:hypothetical protein
MRETGSVGARASADSFIGLIMVRLRLPQTKTMKTQQTSGGISTRSGQSFAFELQGGNPTREDLVPASLTIVEIPAVGLRESAHVLSCRHAIFDG